MVRICPLILGCFALSAQDSPDEFRVGYTGRLLGYARTPDLQVLVEKPGYPSPVYEFQADGGGASPVASALRRQVAEFRSEGGASLLLGLGDNFAMDFRSRAVLIRRAGRDPKWVRKDHLVFDVERNGWADLNDPRDARERQRLDKLLLAGDPRIGHDNVATFLQDMGFDALVPGRQDFYYGPQRLRQLARLLASGSRPVPMLASNLVIRATRAVPVPAKSAERLDEERGFVSRHDLLSWTPPAVPLPWMRRVRLRRAFTDGVRNFDVLRWCKASTPLRPCPDSSPALVAVPDPDPKSKDWDAWIYATHSDALVFTREDLRRGRADLADQARQLEEAKLPPIPVQPLEPDTDYTACAYFTSKPNAASKPKPYCSTIRIAKPFFDHDSNLVQPYALRNGIVIIGAVNPGMERAVGVLNSQWLHARREIDVSAVTTEPTEAIAQVIEYCRAKGDCRPGTRYLLLAQMPQADAEVLNRRLRSPFLGVFAQPDEFDATSPVPVEYPAEYAAMTFVPPPAYSNGDVRVSLRTARFRRDGPGARHEVNTGSAPAVVVRTRDDGPDCLTEAMNARGGQTGGQAGQFSTLVLQAMRKAARADAAILQKRDLFELDQRIGHCSADPRAVDPRRIAVEGILWKGDLLATRTITGAQLKSVLAQSDAFEALDRDPYADHGAPGQGLIALGLDKDAGVWFVNGEAVSDGRLYSVAMPDFLAFGDTGYADLRRQPVPPAIRITDLGDKKLTPIADLVLAAMGGPPPAGLPASEYLDRSTQLPPDGPARASFLDQVREQVRHWGLLYPSFRRETPAALGQSRPYWRLFVDQGSIGYTEYRNNQPSAAEIASRFKGISESGVNSREARTWISAAHVELRRETIKGNLFSRVETGFSNQTLQAGVTGGELTRNYLDNRISWESGVRRVVIGNARQRPWLGLLASVQTASQLRQPFEVLPGAAAAIAIPRTSRVGAKFGARLEGRRSWIESGLVSGWVRRARPDLTGSLTGSGTNRENGFFLNFNSVLPLPAGIGIREFTFTNRTRFYTIRDSDLAVDTRLLERFEASVTVPIWGNVSLRPTYGLLLFENKKLFNFLVGRTFSVRLDYRFDHTSGASWRQVLGFGRP